MCKCLVCERIELTKEGKNPYFVRELQTGYVVLGDIQRFKGYTLFLCKQHVTELHFLDCNFRNTFLHEMSLVAEAVYNAFRPEKLNYELLGVGNAVHMHWHIFPRKTNDTPTPGPVWRLDKSELNSDLYRPTMGELNLMREKLGAEIDKLFVSL